MSAAATTMLEIDDILAIPTDILNSINSSQELNCTMRMNLADSTQVANNGFDLLFSFPFFLSHVTSREYGDFSEFGGCLLLLRKNNIKKREAVRVNSYVDNLVNLRRKLLRVNANTGEVFFFSFHSRLTVRN